MGVNCQPYYSTDNANWHASRLGYGNKGKPHLHAERYAMSNLTQSLNAAGVAWRNATVLLIQNAFPCMDTNGCHDWLCGQSNQFAYIYVRVDGDQGSYSTVHVTNGLLQGGYPRVLYYRNGSGKYLRPGATLHGGHMERILGLPSVIDT
ncbi:hypothetical protein FHP25_12110 [Vineibacter terrae]|uniref:Uncharacterized protein n=1 Tax=Vineibacter terrae TaxID=2586908 RepID=A0A5C8PPD5_9HYPH|nr:hypothetical protein [Vineibacter terrae]TXL76385.1 hypothetical protein FHP25_12110 [Vineibacter terrae]